MTGTDIYRLDDLSRLEALPAKNAARARSPNRLIYLIYRRSDIG